MHIIMDWKSINFDWNRARAFLATAEEGSLSAAARALGLKQSTLSRQVAALEQELGVVLFDRAGRGLTLTESGADLRDHVRAMGKAASGLAMAASGRTDVIAGEVCISVGDIAGMFQLPRILEKLRQQEPGIKIDLIASSFPSDLKRREADIAVRHFEPNQAALVAAKVAENLSRLYATPDYLSRIGSPEKPQDLARADFIVFDRSEAQLRALNRLGLDLTPENFAVSSMNQIVQWELVKQGVGIGMMRETIGDMEPMVVRVLPDLPPIVSPTWIVAHRELYMSKRVRLVYDMLVEELA